MRGVAFQCNSMLTYACFHVLSYYDGKINTDLKPEKYQPFDRSSRLKTQKYSFGDVAPITGADTKLAKAAFVSSTYAMNKSPHGIAVIIDNEQFETKVAVPGYKHDRDNLTTLFRYLDYKVWVYKNLSNDQMKAVMDDIRGEDHSEYDSFFCCILTRGHAGGTLFASNDAPVKLDQLTDKLKGYACSSLVNKPKIFIVHAGRGEREQTPLADGDTIPDTTDFAFCFPTPDGYRTYFQGGDKGSWYIEEMCRSFTQYATSTAFIDIMQKVHERVASTTCESNAGPSTHVENPEMTSRLRKHIFFFQD